MAPALVRAAACAWRPCFAAAQVRPVSRVVVAGGVVAPRGSQTARLRAATRPMAMVKAAVVAPLRAHQSSSSNSGGRWAGRSATNVGGGSRGFGCGVGGVSKRGIVSAAAAAEGGEGDEGDAGEGNEGDVGESGDEEPLAPAPALSAKEQAKLDKEAAAFAQSWALELSAAAWSEMGDDTVRYTFLSRTNAHTHTHFITAPPAT
jgi:hypothetical protein